MNSLRSLIQNGSALQLAILFAVVIVTALTGGSSQATMPALIFLRPLLALALVVSMMLPSKRDWRNLRAPAILLALFAASMVIQLVPVPAAWWATLAGRARYAVGVEASGASSLAISLAPDLTLNSLLALLPATCVVTTYAAMRPEHRRATAWLVAALSIASLLFALGQLSGSGYLYARQQDNYGGLLANRNHQAVLLAVTLPLLAVLARQAVLWRNGKVIVVVLAAVGVVILPMILLTGSRQGLVIAAIALLVAMPLLPRAAVRSGARHGLISRILLIGLVVLVVVVVAVWTDRAASIQRFMAPNGVAEDVRLRSLPTVIAMTREFFPVGIGYGAFDPVYRGFEPDALLNSSYYNHAHNDLLEAVLTGGLPAALLILALTGYLVMRGVRMFGRDVEISRGSFYLDRAGLAIVALLSIASLADYPLRTPIVSLVVALVICWVSAPPAPRKRVRADVDKQRDKQRVGAL